MEMRENVDEGVEAEAHMESSRILLVDDAATFRTVIAGALRVRGYDVVEAGNGREAFEIATLEPSRMDLILLDLAMPGMDGVEFLSALERRKGSVPVVVLTAMPGDEARHRLRNHDVAAVLVKSRFSVHHLCDTCQRVLARPDVQMAA